MYNIEKHKHLIAKQDAETQKRFGLVEKLSKGFTVENKIALEMDKLLSEQMELTSTDEPKTKSTTHATSHHPTPKKHLHASSTDIDQLFTDLFDALKNQEAPTIPNKKIGFSDLDEEVQRKLFTSPNIIKYDIPKSNTSAFKKPEIASFQQIVDDVVLGNNVMLIGGAGTGKTYMAENLVAKMALGRQHITINCSQWTAPTEIIGGQTMDGYVEGKLIEAWANGYILVLDELPKIDPNTAGLFNDALAKTKIPAAIIFNSRKESFAKHSDFACIATGNIYPDRESSAYGANNKQDLSLLDRFSGSVYFIEKNPIVERDILKNDMLWSICDKIRSVIEELKYEAQLSLRFMQNARDAYILEMQRIKETGNNGIKSNEGKTFKSSVDSYISTFTEVQQKNIKDKIRYDELFPRYEYREFATNKMVY